MNALPIARLFGFEIRVHVSWAIILAVIGVTAATQVAVIAPGIGTAGGWVIGVVGGAPVPGRVSSLPSYSWPPRSSCRRSRTSSDMPSRRDTSGCRAAR